MKNKKTSPAPLDPSATPWNADPSGDGFFDVVSATNIVLAKKCIEEEAELFAAAPDLKQCTRYLLMVCEDRLSIMAEEFESDPDVVKHYKLLKKAAVAALKRAGDTFCRPSRQKHGVTKERDPWGC